MARSIPTYDRGFLATGVQGGGKAVSSVPSESTGGAALANLGASMGNLGTEMAQEQKKVQSDRAAVDVANVLSQGEVYWQQNFTERAKAWSPGGADMRDGIGKDFDKWMSENEQKLPTEASKKYFQQHAIKMRTSMQTNAYSYQEKATSDKLNADTVVAEQADENTVFADPSRFDDVYRRRAETLLARTDLTDAEKIRQSDVYKRRLSVASERGQMEKDPLTWYRQRFGEPKLPGVAPDAAAAPAAGGSTAIANAIYGQESSSGKADTSKVNSQNVTGPMQVQEGTFNGMKKLGIIPADYNWKNPEQNKDAGFKWVDHLAQKYGGDPEKVAAAYYGGEGAVNADGSINRHWKNKQRPGDPSVGQYVDQIVGRIKKGPDAGDATAATAPKSFTSLDWEQQSALRAQADGKIRQEDTKIVAAVVGKTADTAVAAQNIGVDLTVDLARAKTEAVAAARKELGRTLDDGQINQVEAAVERAAGVRERDRKRGQENVAQAVFDELDKNGGDYQAVKKAMPAELDKLPREVQVRAQDYAGKVATGQTRETDWVAYSQLVDDPKTLAVTNLSAIRDKFGSNEYAQLAKLQEAGKKNTGGAPDQTILGDMAVVKGLLKDAGITSKTKEAQFFSVLQREMDARRGNDPKAAPLKQAEVKAIAADLLTREITHKGVLWDTKTPAFQVEVPATERAKIQAALNEAGLPVNDSTILRAYRNKLSRGAAPQPAAPKTSQTASGTIKY